MRTLGITLGDVTGIGPEVALKALKRLGDLETAFLLIGDREVIRSHAKRAGFEGEIASWSGGRPSHPGIWQLNPEGCCVSLAESPGSAASARAAIAALRAAADLSLKRVLDGVVTAPVNKEAILKTGQPFVGQTEFLTHLAGDPATGMMLLGQDDRGRWLRVMLVTTHLPLSEVPAAITPVAVRRAIELASQARRELRLTRSRIGVCGLNPHAGEGGHLGQEEIVIISPCVQAARAQGMDVEGPFAADTLFHRALQGDFDFVVAMYHDQGLAPLKLVAFDTGVNWTVGLPFVRTSPDHGTAYEIAGQNRARPDSMCAAIRLASQLCPG